LFWSIDKKITIICPKAFGSLSLLRTFFEAREFYQATTHENTVLIVDDNLRLKSTKVIKIR
jgi:hypothetical protein